MGRNDGIDYFYEADYISRPLDRLPSIGFDPVRDHILAIVDPTATVADEDIWYNQ